MSRRRARGVALVIVLAFVVLLSGLVLAFFSRALSERLISNSSANAVRVDLFAQDAVATTLGDLRQEMAAGSVITQPSPAPSPAVYLYNPKAPATAVPSLAGVTGSAVANLPNLVKRSATNTPFYTGTSYDTTNYPPSNRAANSSSISVSLNGRTISPARWNKGLLLPKQTPGSDTDFTPSTNDFKAPDWIVVARDGTNPTTFDSKLAANGTNAAIGRYAYNIYNEGGLLDMNAAGYPDASGVSAPLSNDPAYKSSLAFADLKQLPGISDLPGGANGRQEQIVRTLVGWRNYATAAIDLTQNPPTATAPISGSVNVSPGYQWASGSAAGNVFNYLNFLRLTDAGFLNVANPLVVNHQSDRSFASRQQLINLLLNSIADQTSSGTAERAALQNSLQYLGTFSRSLNQPSYFPVSRVLDAKLNPNPRPAILPSANTTDPTKGGGNNIGDFYSGGAQDALSPSFLMIRAEAAFLRNDGVTPAVAGEPLVKTRFALKRLAWLTYKGPSFLRTIPLSNPGVDSADYDMWQMVNNYGISRDYLKQGTVANIQRYFGLEWDGTNHRWKYDLHNRGGAAAGNVTNATGVIRQLQEIADLKTREPDFFELLKASVDPGALAKASVQSSTADLTEGVSPVGSTTGIPLAPLNFQFFRDIAYDGAIMQLGANMIDQFDADGYPTRIIFDDGGGRGAREIRGVENLPYIYRMRYGLLRVREPNPEGTANTNNYGAGKRNPGSTDTANDGCTPERHSGAVPAVPPTNETTYPVIPLRDTGVGILLAVPDIWNPHDQNSSLGSPRPGLQAGSFRIIASSTTPDGVDALTTPPPNYSALTVGGNGISSNDKGRHRGSSYEALRSGGGGAEPAGAIPAGAPPGYNTPVPPFSRVPTPTGTSTNLMTNGYNNAQIICSVPVTGSPTATSSILSFAVPDATLFREPTLLGKPDTTSGSGLSMSISNPDVTQLVGDSGSVWTGTGLKISVKTTGTINPLNQPTAPPNDQPYIGLYLGAFPLRWVGNRWANAPYIAPSDTFWVYTDRNPAVLGGPAASVTYTLQCQDAFGNWVSYDQKYVNTDVTYQWVPGGLLMDNTTGTFAFVDPRTSRFGAPDEQYAAFDNPITADSPHTHAPTKATWLDNTTDVITTERSDIHAGFGANMRGTYGSPSLTDWNIYAAAGWHFQNIYANGVNKMFYETGLFAQNDPTFGSDGIRYQGDAPGPGGGDAQFYTDPDGVVRRGMAAFVASATGPLGQPLATASNYSGGKSITPKSQSASRPKMLNRPFRSVGELGYVFSGTPWKNLDFSTPESGYSELLDVFCVNETTDANGLVAGKLDLNTRQPKVLAAMLAGTLTNDTTVGTLPLLTPNATAPTGTDATDIANLLVKRTTVGPASPVPNVTGPQPLANVADLVGKWTSKQTLAGSYTPQLYPNHNVDGSKSYDGFSRDIGTASTNPATTLAASNPVISPIEAQRETAIRALANVGNTRVWNLLIDVIAQTGRYPTGATGLNNFAVEGEQRCWMHVAIDRATGQVVDSKLEIVKE